MKPTLQPISIEGNPADRMQHIAIVDADANRVLGIATKNYRLIHHAEVDEVCESVFPSCFGDYQLQSEFYGNEGARMFKSYIFPKHRCEIYQHDFIYLGLLVQNSYDLSFGVNFDLRGYRQKCGNDLPTAGSIFRLSAKHTIGIELGALKSSLKNILPAFKLQIENWRQWQKIEISKGKIKQIVDEVFSSKKLREESFAKLRKFDFCNKQFTKWDLFMLLTNISTHSLDLQRARQLSGKILQNLNTAIGMYHHK